LAGKRLINSVTRAARALEADTLDGWVLGPIGHQAYPRNQPNAINPHPILRKHYDLFANIRPAKSLPGLPALYPDVDLIIVRENNEGFPPDRNTYLGSGEFRPTPEMTISIRLVTREGSRKVARAAFDLARTRLRKKVTAVHKGTACWAGISRRGRNVATIPMSCWTK
jgi:3-isopropylmalate dehydrogenase